VKFKLLLILPLSLLLLFSASSSVEAHPGRTDASGGHTCRTNCESWGLGYGEYHSHGGGGTSGSSTGQSYNAPVQQVVTLPTTPPIPQRLPTKIPTRIPTNTPAPSVTFAPSPTAIPSPTIEPTKKPKVVKASVQAQKPQGFLDWLFSLFTGR
jgi:hypothetical protein